MSETMTTYNLGAALAGTTRAYTGMFLADLKYMPEGSITESRGGATRSVAGITADAAWLADCCATIIRGETPATTDYAKHVELVPSLTTAEACATCMQNAGNALAAAIESLSPEKYGELVMAPWGVETTLFALGNTAASHIWYHDAQLNYIQALAGDGDVHWRG